MGNRLFGADIAGELARNLGPLLPKMRLLKKTVGARTSGSLTSGRSVSYRGYSCRGILEAYSESRFPESTIEDGDRKALILGDTLPRGIVPDVGDRIEAEGSTFTVVSVMRDPDAASYTCQIRD